MIQKNCKVEETGKECDNDDLFSTAERCGVPGITANELLLVNVHFDFEMP